jgi:hypothetical protein
VNRGRHGTPAARSPGDGPRGTGEVSAVRDARAWAVLVQRGEVERARLLVAVETWIERAARLSPPASDELWRCADDVTEILVPPGPPKKTPAPR